MICATITRCRSQRSSTSNNLPPRNLHVARALRPSPEARTMRTRSSVSPWLTSLLETRRCSAATPSKARLATSLTQSATRSASGRAASAPRDEERAARTSAATARFVAAEQLIDGIRPDLVRLTLIHKALHDSKQEWISHGIRQPPVRSAGGDADDAKRPSRWTRSDAGCQSLWRCSGRGPPGPLKDWPCAAPFSDQLTPQGVWSG